MGSSLCPRCWVPKASSKRVLASEPASPPNCVGDAAATLEGTPGERNGCPGCGSRWPKRSIARCVYASPYGGSSWQANSGRRPCGQCVRDNCRHSSL
eukprot:scaffold5217_cov632-Prasinococcus_capsulatus_cf.AAC.4